MQSVTAATRSREDEVEEVVDAARRSVRSLRGAPDPQWLWRDFGRRGSAERLRQMVVIPAEKKVPLEDALELPIALASLVLVRYEPVVPSLKDVLHDVTVAHSRVEILASLCRNYPESAGAVERLKAATMTYRVHIDRLVHSAARAARGPRRAA